MNASLTTRKPLKSMVFDLLNELNGDINFASKSNLNHNNNHNRCHNHNNGNVGSTKEIKPYSTITLFKKDFLVGRSLSNEKTKPITESSFLNRAINTTKSTDFTFDILKKLTQRQESLYLNTEYDTRHGGNNIEQKKKQIISLLNSGRYTINSKNDSQRDKRHIISDNAKSKVMTCLMSLQKKLETKNNYPK